MLLRFMMVVLLLVVSAVPAWAGEKDVTDDWKEYFRQKYYQRVVESPLSKLTVATKDWRDGDTYYVCHMITNPTKERIEKDLTRIQVSYDTHNPDITNSYHQYVDVPTDFVIEPNGTVAITLPLPIPKNDPIDIIEYRSTLFEFTDRSFIDVPMIPFSSDIHVSPIFSPTGDLAISVQNSTSDTTITEMRDINLSAQFRKKSDNKSTRFYYYSSDIVPLYLKPNEHTVIPVPKQYADNDDDLLLTEFSLKVRLNDAVYRVAKTVAPNASSDDEATRLFTPKLRYHPSFAWNFSHLKGDGTFEVDGNKLTCYFRIKNTHSEIVTLEDPLIRSLFIYYDQNDLLQVKHIECAIPPNTTLAPNEEVFFSASAILPSDHAVQYPFIEWQIPPYLSGYPQLLTESKEPLSQSEKERYTDLGTSSFAPLQVMTETFYLGLGYSTNQIFLLFLL